MSQIEYASGPMEAKGERLELVMQFEMGLERYSNLIDRIDTALATALRPPSPIALDADRPADASKLRALAFQLSDLNDRLAVLLERIDL